MDFCNIFYGYIINMDWVFHFLSVVLFHFYNYKRFESFQIQNQILSHFLFHNDIRVLY